VRAWIVYSALRVGVFLVLFALLFALTNTIGLQPAWLIAAVVAALLALCISYIFFRPLRERVALDVAAARSGTARVGAAKAGSDEDVEDAARGD
jgi:inner membrane protein involved in colicin E2 resistance